MDLYTDQMHLKRLLAGDATPAWTPLTEQAQKIVNPDFVPGMGVLSVHPETGKPRCPVCGKYFDQLSSHLNGVHQDIGGMVAVKKVLDMPRSVRLSSERLRQRRAEIARVAWEHGRCRITITNEARQRGHRKQHSTKRSLAWRNMRDTCDAQLAHRIIDLANRLGRTPSQREFEEEYSRGKGFAVIQVYGTWNNALALCGLQRWKAKSVTSADVLPGLQAWYDMYGELPSAYHVKRRRRSPALPTRVTILRAFGVESWQTAMEMAASHLNIYGGCYGLPVENKPKESDDGVAA